MWIFRKKPKIALFFFTVLLLTACSNLESSGFDQNGIHKVTKSKYNEKNRQLIK